VKYAVVNGVDIHSLKIYEKTRTQSLCKNNSQKQCVKYWPWRNAMEDFFSQQLWPICERLQSRNAKTFYDSFKWRILAFCHALPSAIDNTAHKHKDGSFASPEVDSFLLLLQRGHEGRELHTTKLTKR